MRQIKICAFLFLFSAVSACGGGEFSSGSSTTAQGGASGTRSEETAGRQAGSHSSGTEGLDVDAGGSQSQGGAAGGATSNGHGGSSATGNSNSGKSSTDGGNSSGGESSPALAACASGDLTFRMLPSPKLAADYLCDAGCGTGWLSITDEKGAQGFPISSACGTASCESCEVQQCAAAACLAQPLTAEGSELGWTGTYLAKGTCGGSNMVCQRHACVKPGKYRARACAALNGGANVMGGCTPKDEQLCAEVDFELPATKTVELVLGE